MISEDELDVLLIATDPRASRMPSRAGEALDTALVRLLENVVGEPVPPTRHRARPRGHQPRPLRRRMVTAAGALVAVLVVALVGGGAFGGSGGGRSSSLPLAMSSADAAQMDSLAHAATGSVGPSSAQFLYESLIAQGQAALIISHHRVTFTYAIPVQVWLSGRVTAAGKPAILREGVRPGRGTFTFADPADRRYLLNPQDARLIQTIAADSRAFSFGALPPGDEKGLPTQPQALIAALDQTDSAAYAQSEQRIRVALERENSVRHLHWSTARINAIVDRNRRRMEQTGTPLARWDGLSTILETSPSARLRAAALQALKYVAGAMVIGRRTDARGRKGIAIERHNSSETTDVMIVNPSTGNLLEETVTVSHIYPDQLDPGSVGTVLSREIWLRRSVVDHVGESRRR